ncbi:MAG: hypothetical protein K2K32_09065, partial [Muribaculaceae bacterium]|nr:hypothetical protein [Muribaculaceae bacterium]
MVLFPGGYATLSGSNATFHYYTQDYLGNNRAVINGSNGTIEQTVAYYPFGGIIADLGTKQTSGQPFKFGGKELTTANGLNEYDFGARRYFQAVPHFTSIDPLCEVRPDLGNPTMGQPYKFGGKELLTANGLNEYDFGARRYFQAVPHFTSVDPLCEVRSDLSPYLYCGNDLVNAFDPDGRSTWVSDFGNGMYQVIGGDLNDNDLNIYLYSQDKEGKYTVRGKSIGKTTSITSFYNTDDNNGEGNWMTGSVIDSNDGSGEAFFYNLIADDPSLFNYVWNAQNGEKYDFKVTNGTSEAIPWLDPYRGMPLGFNEEGDPIFTSARDIGNIGAGYVAARKGISWKWARTAFDGYQKHQSNDKQNEGLSTQNAERFGYDLYKNRGRLYTIPPNLRSH